MTLNTPGSMPASPSSPSDGGPAVNPFGVGQLSIPEPSPVPTFPGTTELERWLCVCCGRDVDVDDDRAYVAVGRAYGGPPACSASQ
jgi:hypothetical protein